MINLGKNVLSKAWANLRKNQKIAANLQKIRINIYYGFSSEKDIKDFVE